MEEHEIDPIDVVVVNLYRFREAAQSGISEEEVVENIDIGGPAMIRSAAKNHAHVTVVVDPSDYDEVGRTLGSADDEALRALRRRLAARAFAHTAAYDSAIATWFAERLRSDGDTEFESRFAACGDKIADLRYGENPHQRAAFFKQGGVRGPHLASARQLNGKELSYNNIVDLDAALALAMEFERPACAIIKHTNPCGTGRAESAPAAFRAAFAADPLSAFGGIIAFNRAVDPETAKAIVEADLFVEAIIAPEISLDAVEVLKSGRGGKTVRLLDLGGRPIAPPAYQIRQVLGGFLLQTPDAPQRTPPQMDPVAERTPDATEREALAFAWKVCKHVKSNAIVLAARTESGDLATVGVGAGQMSRVDSVKIAVEKAGDSARGAVLASDAFFPFPDGVEVAAAAGVRAVIQPGGSRNDDSVIAAANAADMAMVFTGTRHFRH